MNLLMFAKIFEVGAGQVLIYKSYDNNADKYDIVQLLSIEDDADVTMKLSFKEEVARDVVFSDYSQGNAEMFKSSVSSLLFPKEG